MVTIPCIRDSKRDTNVWQSFGLCGRGKGWDGLGEWHWNMYNIIYEMNRQSRFDAWYCMLGAGALRRPRGVVLGGRRKSSSIFLDHSPHPASFSSVQLLSRAHLFVTPWTAACQASLSMTNSQNLHKLMSIESVMPSNPLILCCPLLFLPSILFASRS